jgi:sulfur-carrier protein
MASLTVRFFAGARAAAEMDSEVLTFSEVCTVHDVLCELSDRHGPELAKVLAACSFLLDEVAVRSHDAELYDGAVLDVLPPFAGG